MNQTPQSPDEIPEQIRDEPLIRVSGVDHDIRKGSAGSAPKPGDGAANGPFFDADDNELIEWIENGGNIGVASKGDLVLIDVDDVDEWENQVDIDLIDTFTVRSGGGGLHLYYRCADWNQGASLRKDGEEIFSIRATNSFVVAPPSVHHSTGNRYSVKNDEPIKSIHSTALSRLYDIANPSNKQPTKQPEQASSGGGGSGDGGGLPPCSGCAVDEYPSRNISVGELKSWVNGNDLPAKYDWDHRNPNKKEDDGNDESAADFILCKCMAESGASAESIKKAMDKHRASGTKWHWKGADYQDYTISNAIEKAVEDTYVDFSKTADMGSGEPERRKTENESVLQAPTQEVFINMSESDDNVSNKVTAKNGSGDFARAGIVTAENDGDTWDYTGVVFGEIEEEDDELGQVVSFEHNQYGSRDYRDLGNRDPEQLRLAAEALEDLADEIEG